MSRRYSTLVRKLEKWLQRIPTWLAVLLSVLFLAAVALWIQEDVTIQRPADLMSREVLKIFFDNAESFAIIAAVILYFKDAPNRKAQKHHEAWRSIDSATANKLSTSYARFRAIEELQKDGVPLPLLQAPGANLVRIRLPHACLVEANLRNADLRDANLQKADLTGAQLQGADLRGANLRGAKLRRANLEEANLQDATLTEANLQEANLRGASLRSAELWKTQFLGANLERAELKWAELQGSELNGAKVKRTVMPDGSIEDHAVEYWAS